MNYTASPSFAGKLTHRVLLSTSEYHKHPASLLDSSSKQSDAKSFWLSSDDCVFPQFLVLEFENLVELQKILIMSHEYCIASRVELHTSIKSSFESDPTTDLSSFESLGQFAFDTNERSDWHSRELKTVHIEKVCRRLKLRLDAPHMNKLNYKNQVGLASIVCYGEVKEPLSPSKSRSSIKRFDPVISSSLSQLDAQLQKADSAGDKAVAQNIRASIKDLHKIESQVDELEKEKKEAIRLEDFDLAKNLKSKIDSLRKTSIAKTSSADGLKDRMIGSFSNILGTDQGITSLPKFGLPQSDSLPVPDPLPNYFGKDYPHILEALGDKTVAHLLSRDWRLRERGVDQLMSRLRDSSEIDVSSVSWVVKKLSSEKIVNLLIKLCELVQLLTELGPDVQEPLADTIEFAVIFFIKNKLADSNRRLQDSVILTLVRIASSSAQSAQLVYHFLLKGVPSSKVISARCLGLLSVIQSNGMKGKKAVSLDAVIQALGEWYPKTTSGETRLALMQVLAEVVRQAGEDKVEVAIRSSVAGHSRDSLLFELNRLPIRTVMSPSGATEAIIVCEFCGKKDRDFALEERMDLHYWEQCPALIECPYCEQVVELLGLTEHRLKECDSREAQLIDS